MSDSNLFVLTYDSEDKAAEVLQAVAGLKQENVQKPLIGIEDAAVVVKNADGKVRVRQTLESVAKGGNVATGGLWGLLIGFLFGGPLFGALLGMGLSALFGRSIDLGIDNTFIKNVGEKLTPGDSALFLLIHGTSVETIASALGPYGGTLYHTSLSPEAAEMITKAAQHEPLARAVAAENTDDQT